jgi:DNA polymerase-3 subunit delta
MVYKRELDELIRSKNLPSSLLLYGDSYMSFVYSDFIAKELGDRENMLKLYFEEYDFSMAKNYLSQPSLFGDINLLYLKTDKKIVKKELDELILVCQKNSTSFFIFEFCGDDRVGKDIARAFVKKKDADNVRFFKPNLKEAIEFLSKKAKKLQLDIDSFALTHLYRVHNEEISLCVNELEKLKLLDKKVTTADIDKHTFGLAEVDIDTFIELLLSKDEIKESLFKLIEVENIEEIRLLNAIENYITTLLLFRLYIVTNGSVNVVDILGYPLPSHLANKRATLSNKITIPQFKDLLTHLSDAEYTLKTSTNIDKKSFLISTLIKLQTYL